MRQNDSLPTASTDLTAAIPAVDRRGLPAASASANRKNPDVRTVLARPLARKAAVAASAPADSAESSRKYDTVYLDHDTPIGSKLGIPNYQAHEIGRSLEVWWREKKGLVKAEVQAGVGPAAAKANTFWSSLVNMPPPAPWRA